MRSLRAALTGLGILLGACGGASGGGADPYYGRVLEYGRVNPSGAEEQAVLDAAGRLPVGDASAVGRIQVVAGPLYAAASGLRCRMLDYNLAGTDGEASRRLACVEPEADAWFFAPQVFDDAGALP